MPKKSKKNEDLPNLDNATPSFLVDELGSIRSEQKVLKKREGYIKAALQARIKPGEYKIEGEKYAAEIIEQAQMRIDTDLVKTEMGSQWWEDHCKLVEFQQIKVTEIKV